MQTVVFISALDTTRTRYINTNKLATIKLFILLNQLRLLIVVLFNCVRNVPSLGKNYMQVLLNFNILLDSVNSG
jgi:hypothetical protein